MVPGIAATGCMVPEWLTENALLALIAQIGAIMVAVVGSLGLLLVALVNRTRQHAKAARAQVENSHTTNLREEGDVRHEELVSLVTTMQASVDEVKDSQSGLRKDVGRLADSDIEANRRATQLAERLDRHMLAVAKDRDEAARKIDDLERTLPKSEIQRILKERP